MAYWDRWADRWIILDWRILQMDLIVNFDFEMEEVYATALAANATIIEFKREIHVEPSHSMPLINYCTTLIAHFLGVSHGVILTPYGLYRKLLKLGGKEVYSWRKDNEFRQSKSDNTAKKAGGFTRRKRTAITCRPGETRKPTI